MTQRSKSLNRWYRINPRPGKMVRTNFEADAWDLEGHSDVDFQRGNKITDWKGEGWFAASTPDMEGPLEDVVRTANLLPAFSERLKTALEVNNICGLQYLPIRVLSSSRRLLDSFYLINLLNNLSALDEEQSIIKTTSIKNRDGSIQQWVSGIENIVLRNSVLQHFDIMQLSNFTGTFFVSHRFKQIFEQGRFTGWGFWPVEVSDK